MADRNFDPVPLEDADGRLAGAFAALVAVSAPLRVDPAALAADKPNAQMAGSRADWPMTTPTLEEGHQS